MILLPFAFKASTKFWIYVVSDTSYVESKERDQIYSEFHETIMRGHRGVNKTYYSATMLLRLSSILYQT